MTKGKYGLSLPAVAILSFVLAFFGFLEVLVLFLAFALILEKDQWLSRQVLQAFYLRLTYSILQTVIGWVFTAFGSLFGLIKVYGAVATLSSIQSVILFLLHIGLFVLILMAILQLAKGKEARLPVIADLVDKTFGIFKPKPQVQQPAYQPPVAQTAPPPTQTAPPAQAVPPPPVAPPYVAAPPAAIPSEPPAPLAPLAEAEEPVAPVLEAAAASPEVWTCSCGRTNKGKFCMGCGKPRPQ